VHISASLKNARDSHNVTVTTGSTAKSLNVPCREAGCGSAINGGEFLMLALATCYCNASRDGRGRGDS
jgi:organic hydroperoxide reductase OsmC/OhrA